MNISIWFPKDEYVNISPTTVVYSIRLTCEGLSNLLCDICWTDKEEVMNHFWVKRKSDDEKLRFVEMAFENYIKKHVSELSGMNPFRDLGRIEFLDKYNEKWNLNE